jgi:hypothetical protein
MHQGRAQAVARALGWFGAAVVLAAGAAILLARTRRQLPRRSIDYSNRSGFRQPASAMRGTARGKVKERRLERPGQRLGAAAAV